MRNSILKSFILLVLVFSATAFADTWSSSVISSNTTWLKNNTSGDGVYVVNVANDTLIVNSGITLTIEPGVTVKFHGDTKLLVYGTLVAQGTVQDSIYFMLDDAPGSASEWGGIKILSNDSNSSNILAYCVVQNADADGIGLSAPDDSKNGGGIYFGSQIAGNTKLSHSIIQYNHAYEGGGGVAFAGSPEVSSCLIRNNSADQYGGGVSIKGPTPTTIANPQFANTIIVNNSANAEGGGGVGLLYGATLDMTHSLIFNNHAPNGAGGGIHLSSITASANIVNSIIGGNSANTNAQISGTVNITYSDIENGYSGIGNIDADPAFFDETNGDYHFGATSPLVDAADNASSLADDFDGVARPFDGDRNNVATSDIGPYEYVNTAPQITSNPVLNATEDAGYSYQVLAYDPDLGEILTYSLTAGPSFLSVNAGTGEISGNPNNDSQAGEYSVTVQVTDLNGAFDTQSYTLTVTAVNDQPVVSGLIDQGILEGETFTTINLDDFVSDEESADDLISWTYAGNLQLGVSISNRVATITMPSSDWYGSETITFTGTDPGGLSDNDAAVFTATNINDAPVVSSIPDQTINEGANFAQVHLDNYVNDIDNVESDLSWSFAGNSQLSVSIDANRIATISAPDADWFGSETITFTVKDPGGLEDSDAAVFTVDAVNDAPVVAGISDQTIDEAQSFSSINLDDFVTDVDDDITTLLWTYTGNTELIVNISAQRVASISIPDTNWYGNEQITFTATDTSGATGEQAITFTVNNINDAPQVSAIPAQTIDEGASFALINLNDYVNDVDDADASISWTVSGNTDLLYNIDQNNQATITVPNADWFGSEDLTFSATDPGMLSANTQVTFTVNAVNDAPVVADIPDQSIFEGQTFAAFDLDTLVSDVDDPIEALVWSYSGNTQLLVSIDGNNLVSVSSPDSNLNLSEEITFTAHDTSGAFAADVALFTINPVNDPPVVQTVPAQTIAEGQSFELVFLDDYVDDPDNPYAEITWTVSGNQNLSVSIDAAHAATISAIDSNWFGSETLTFKASDPEGLADSVSSIFTITAVNDAPVITAIPEQVSAEGESFTPLNLDDFVNDVDDYDSSLVWQVSADSSLIAGIENRILTVSVSDPEWNGSAMVYLSVRDTSGLADSGSVSFVVTAVNDSTRFIANAPDRSFNEDDSLDIAIQEWFPLVEDTDNPDSTLIFTLYGSETIHTQKIGNIYRLKSAANWFGSDSLQLAVSDGQYTDSRYFLLTVNPVNDAPQIVDLPAEITFNNDTSYVLNLFDFMLDVDSADSLLSWMVSENQDSLLSTFDAKTGLLTFSALQNYSGTVEVALSLTDDYLVSAYDTLTVVVSPATAVEDLLAGQLPMEYKLNQNFPNPFNPNTAISYQLPAASEVELSVYNVLGQRIVTLVQKHQLAGYYRYSWDGSGFANGVYFYRIQAGKFSQVRKMILMK